MEILLKLYESEISWSVSALYDMGYEFALGDEINGVQSSKVFRSFDAGARWLAHRAVEFYPDSGFAKWWRGDGGKRC